MPSLSGLFAKAPEGPLRIPVEGTVALGFAVYYVPGYPPLSGPELRVRLPAWLDAHVAEPLRGALREFAAGDGLGYTDDLQRGAIPRPPYDLLRSEGAAEEQLERLEKGYQLVMVSARDANRVPRIGLWTAVAGALSAAEALNGAAYDPARMAVVGLAPAAFPGDGVVRVREHVAFRAGGDAGEPGWVTTAGMSKFGLPELRAGFPAGVPPPLEMLSEVGQQLIDAVLRANHGRDDCVAEVEFGPKVVAAGIPLALRYTAEAGKRGWLDVVPAPIAG